MGSFTQLTYHFVFGTKFRRRSIGQDVAEPLYEYIGGTIRNRKGRSIQIGGVEDHLHLLVGMPPTITVSHTVVALSVGFHPQLCATATFVAKPLPPRCSLNLQELNRVKLIPYSKVATKVKCGIGV